MTLAILSCSEHFVDFALNEIRRYHPAVHLMESLADKHHLIEHRESFSKLTSPWRNKLSIYLHHLYPLQQQLPIDDDLDRFCRRVRACVPAFDRVDVQVMSTHQHSGYSIRQALYPHPNVSSRNPQVLSVLVVDNLAYVGVSPASQNLSPYPFGKHQPREHVPNRAGLKLLESLDSFGIQLRKQSQALDLGAAPGAWTAILRRRDLRVTAVAPAKMYPELQADPDVCHVYSTAERYLPKCRNLFDVIVNDMKMDAQDSARVTIGYADHLRGNGIAIMTLKLRMRRTARVLDHSYRLLRKRYKIIQVRQLVSNKKEITLFLRKKHK